MKSRKAKIWLAVAAVLLCVLSYFAADLPFFTFDEPLERALLTTVQDGDALSFTYANDALTLHTGGAEVTVYALTYSGAAVVEGGSAPSFPADSMGSFAAVAAPEIRDADGDGLTETVLAAAKTDMEFTQEYATSFNEFGPEVLSFEAVFEERDHFILRFQGETLTNASVTVIFPNGKKQTSVTDENGLLKGVSLNDVRDGVTFLYRAADGRAYTLAYRVEDNTLLTLRWLSAMQPFLIIVLLSVICILLDVWLRKGLYKKAGMSSGKTRATARDARNGLGRSGFMTVRWIVMVLSFALLIFGGRLFGNALKSVSLPVFACPYNLDQLTEAGCYMFSHLDLLLSSSLGDILWFIGSFLVCAVVFGRLLCGFVCPLGFLQDVAHEARQALHVEGIALNERLYAILRFIKWVMLVIFLGVGLIGGSFCDFCPALAVSPALAGFKTSLYLGGFVMIAVLVSGFFKRRCFCNICPLGYLVGLLHKVSLFKLKKDVIACTECGACYEACPMGIKSIFTVREEKDGKRTVDVTTPDCILCGECVRRCPEDHGLAITFAGMKVYDASRLRFMRDYTPRKEEALHD